MIRRPRSLFRARRRGPVLYVGPQFTGPEPRYLALLDELARRHADALRSGKPHRIEVRHDDGCSALEGSACDCAPEAVLIELGGAETGGAS
jgi:hypothetical protein